MGFNVNKISGIVDETKTKITTKAAKIAKQVTNEVSEAAPKVVEEVKTSSIAPSEALKAQALVDYQYPAGAHLLGCSPEEKIIQQQLKYCGDLASAREKIKTKTVYKGHEYTDGYLKQLCDQFGEDKVVAEINARLNGAYWVGDGSSPGISKAYVSARNISELNGWGHFSQKIGKWIME